MKQRSTNFKNGLLIALCLILALELLFDGAMKFRNGDAIFGPHYGAPFATLTQATWFHFGVGTVELLGSFFLLSPRTRFPAAAALFIFFICLLLSYIIHKDSLGNRISTAVLLLLTGIVAWAGRPSKWRQHAVEAEPAYRSRPTYASSDQ